MCVGHAAFSCFARVHRWYCKWSLDQMDSSGNSKAERTGSKLFSKLYNFGRGFEKKHEIVWMEMSQMQRYHWCPKAWVSQEIKIPTCLYITVRAFLLWQEMLSKFEGLAHSGLTLIVVRIDNSARLWPYLRRYTLDSRTFAYSPQNAPESTHYDHAKCFSDQYANVLVRLALVSWWFSRKLSQGLNYHIIETYFVLFCYFVCDFVSV